jgi:DUF4097 and DUF4098 domain-containing protein YvlB
MTEHTFPTTGTPQVSFRLPLGNVRIVPGSPNEVGVTLRGRESSIERFRVEAHDDEIVIEPEHSSPIRWSPVELTIRIGEPADVRGRLTSADLAVETTLASLHVESASGDIDAQDVTGDVTTRSASGDIRLGAVGGRLDAAAASGDVRADGAAGGANVKSASGDVHLVDAGAEVAVKTASGDVTVGRFDGSWIDVKSMSGDVTIGVVAGRRFEVSFQSLSGSVRTEFPVANGAGTSLSSPTGDAGLGRISVKTVSGDISVQGAAG